MIDAHIHIEKTGVLKEEIYTLNWIERFVNSAVRCGIEEIYLLEHSYRFNEFFPMYESVCTHSDYIDKWFHRKACFASLYDFLRLADSIRDIKCPIKIKFGLEICYFKRSEEFIRDITDNIGLDFLVGSVHYIDNFAYDHKPEHWDGVDVDTLYQHFFEKSIDLADSHIFNGIAHPDCIKIFGHRPSFQLTDYYRALASSLKKSGMYAEQNSGAARRAGCETGMDKEMLSILIEYGVEIKTASDAHTPDDVGWGIHEMHRDLHKKIVQ